ncbi:RHS repeat-associated core domain-containing protein [Dactylosporangium sp. AC04546]|uniref:RHS repeat domain-containing protein n=1 Tax=Dactylosporangium sp. AC04546 TaxID=2862460 RepID=UPI002E7B3A5E|nr:RHS repeat-associated core domain-containing protein [Dactylosporangium sp. AC04546]WVK84856.1 RHS repeat-associated core domain-containing protein [Dactylosporangium sp. AC04546]
MSVARIAAVCVLALFAAGVPEASEAAPPPRRDAPAVQVRKAAPATPVATRRRPLSDAAAAAAVTAAPSVTWPDPAGADLDLTGGPRRVTLGGMAVTATTVAPGGGASALSAAATPAAVHVGVLHHATATRAGVRGTLLAVNRTDGVASGGTVQVEIDYAGFANAFGGDYGARLHFVRLPACALSTPDRPECRRETVPTTNDTANRRLTATVTATGATTLLAAEAGDTSSQGSYAATKLNPSSKWDVSASSGALSWSYPLRLPPVPGGLAPEVSLGYSSQGVDGRTSNTNNQGSWIGEGFAYEPGYIERRYKACADDGHEHYGDQCWAMQNASLQLAGHSGDLVKVNDNLWKLSNDDGTKVERLTGATNGDNDGEHWKVTTTDGSQYFFGLNRLPGWTANKEETGSTWTVPISGDDNGEPCYRSSGWLDSFCDQGWRWNLDYVKDPHGNVIAYFYGKELNAYAQGGKTDVNGAQYVRGGYLKRIDYGQADGTVYATDAPARVRFDTVERCLPGGAITCAEDQLTADTANSWPDVPFDRACTPGTHCKNDQASATFWTRKRLTTITTDIREGSGWTPVEQWRLGHSFTDNGDGSRTLWLGRIDHSGLYGGTADMPPVLLQGIQLPNRIDTPTDMLAPLNRFRLSSVVTDTGAQVQFNYAPADCGPGNVPTEGNSTRRCYPVKWNPFGTDDDLTDWFHKYVIAQVVQTDPTGGNSDEVTSYEYSNQGFGTQDPIGGGAWRKPAPDGITKDEDRTWSQWRGYPKVTVRSGDQQTLTTKTEHYFFRGMDGDEAPGGGTRSVKVTDDLGNVYTDTEELNGFELETITYNGSQVVSKALNVPVLWYTHTQTETWGTRRSWMVKHATVRQLTALTPTAQGAPVWRETKIVSTYDQTWGRILTEENLGDVGTPADDQCTRTSYLDNDTAYIHRYAKLTEKFSVDCGKTPNRRTQLLFSERKTYDGQAYGAAPTKGDVTEIGNLDSDDGTTTKYLTTTITVNGYGRQVRTVDPNGGTTETTYVFTNGLNTRTTIKNAVGHVTVTDTNPAYGLAVTTTDPNLRRTDLAYDPLGRLTAVWLPNRPRTLNNTPNSKYAYNVRADKPTVITTQKVRNDGTYATSYQLLDSRLRVRQVQSEAIGGWLLTDTVYNSRGGVATQTGNYFAVGAAGDLVLTVPEGSTDGAHKYLYDGVDRQTDDIYVVAGDERWRTRTVYDGASTTTLPPTGGAARTTVVNAQGQTTTLRQYAGRVPGATSTAITYTYAPNGKLATMTDAMGNTWGYTYDQRGNLVETVDPDAGTTKFTFDSLNRMTSAEDARHAVTSYVYDAIGRKTSEWTGKVNTGTKVAMWVYDSFYKGQLSGTVRYSGTAAYTITVPQRDALYNPLKTSYTIPTAAGVELAKTYDFSTTYNPDGTVQTIGQPTGGGLPAESITIGYDQLQRPVSLTGLTSYVVNDATNATHYDTAGGLLQYTLWNGSGKKAWATFSYERGTGRQTGVRVDRESAAAVDMDAHYSYDEAGNVLAIADTPAGGPVDTQCFSYDGYRRMTEAWSTTVTDPALCSTGPAATGVGGPAAYHQSWTFDDVGQRTSQTTYPAVGAAVTENYHYPAAGTSQAHTLTSVDRTGGGSTVDYTYDARGALLTRTQGSTSESFTWDASGRLQRHSKNGADTTYLTDADGNRLLRTEGGATTLYLDGMELRLDLATRAVTGKRFYTFAGHNVATRTPAGTSYTFADLHNTNGCAVDAATGAITWRRTLPYGGERGALPASWPDERGFLGKTKDPGGLVHLGAREYDPVTGRFISVDPVLDVTDPAQINGYSYGGGNPVTFTDPNGTYFPPDDDGEPWTPPVLPPIPTGKCSSSSPQNCAGGEYRKPNNKTEEELFFEWVMVELKGCPTADPCATREYFSDGDPFTEEIKGLEPVDEARRVIEWALANSMYNVGEEYHYDWHLARYTPQERADAAVNNGLGIITHGTRGEQYAIAFMGSYDLTWKIVGKDANGQPVVEYHLTNASTWASAAYNPNKVKDYGPDMPAGDGHDAAAGEGWLQQDVRWRETFVGNKATDHVADRVLAPDNPNTAWRNPSQRDPLVPRQVYDGIEGTLKKLSEWF